MTAAKKSGDKQGQQKALLNHGVDPSVGQATQFQPGQSGNPAGKPKGTISLSTRIKQMLNDEEFETYLPDSREGFKHFKGAPAKAIIQTAMLKAIQGDTKSADWLAKYGYGTKIDMEPDEDGNAPVVALVKIVRPDGDAKDS